MVFIFIYVVQKFIFHSNSPAAIFDNLADTQNWPKQIIYF